MRKREEVRDEEGKRRRRRRRARDLNTNYHREDICHRFIANIGGAIDTHPLCLRRRFNRCSPHSSVVPHSAYGHLACPGNSLVNECIPRICALGVPPEWSGHSLSTGLKESPP